ncbi:MAG: hypothetical protein JW999_04335 [Methanotrichaceae archaeon]|nr:hypothetical protein [Methanotrichaceae archaeon]
MKLMKRGRLNFEIRRKLFHALFGLFLILILFYSGQNTLIIFLTFFLILGSLLIVLMQQGRKIPIADWFEEKFERENVRFPGYGAFWFVVGTLLLALSLSRIDEIAAAIVVLAAGDSAATIFGIPGRHPLPYNPIKTVEGSIAFFVFSLPGCLFVGWMGIALAALSALAESLATPLDDNLLIPLTAILFFILQ